MRRASIVLVLALVASVGCVETNPALAPTGALVQLHHRDTSARTVGELLAVSAESVWVQAPKPAAYRPQAFALGQLDRVLVSRGSGLRQRVVRGAVFGLVSGFALNAACRSVTTGCGAELAMSVAMSSMLGLVAGWDTQRIRVLELEPPLSESLRVFARWPQGLPPRMREAPADSAPPSRR